MNQSLITPDDKPQPQGGALSLESFGSLMAMAVDKGIDLKELVELHERLKKSQAEEAFNRAIQEFQSRIGEVRHDKTADAGTYKYTYASLPAVAATIKPLLAELGLSFSYDTEVENDMITVACTVHHVQGHSRTSKFKARASGTSKMSEIQRFASTTTYGQRYALKMALGLMTVDTDDDGRGARPEHENPPENTSAPKERPRAQRQSAPKQETVHPRLAKIQKVWGYWQNDKDHPERKGELAALSKPERAMRFRNWARVVSRSETLDPEKWAEWTEADDAAFEICELYFAQPS